MLSKLRLSLVAVLMMAFVAIGLTGCKSLASGDQRAELIATVAIQVATNKVISRSGDPAAKALRIVEIARAAKGLADGGSVALVADLHKEINDRIDWAALDPGDTILVQALVSAVRGELEARVDDDLITGDSLVVMHLVLDNIIETASVYVAPD
ncbi:hypothetical protein OAE19_05235 [Porticoccaceae bacterium]|nr:hypothetical protein [Porticoccaceae bacterium]